MDRAPPRLDLTGILEGHHLACILDGLHREGVLAEFAHPARPADVAARRGWDAAILDGLVAFLAARSTLFEPRDDGSYVLAGGGDVAGTAHALDQYVGAFGPGLRDVGQVLRGAAGAGGLFDEARHAAAFAQADHLGDAEVCAIVLQLGVDDLLDLGCGGAGLLIGLARRRPTLTGCGLDANPAAVALARQRIAAEGLQGRLQVVPGDAIEVLRGFPRSRREAVQVVTACSVANAYFGNSYFGDGGTAPVVGLLEELGALLPGRVLIVADYYGRLGSRTGETADVRRTLMHDVVQLVSRQGVPPADVSAWRSIYARAGCTLIDVLEGYADGVFRFIHIVQLSP